MNPEEFIKVIRLVVRDSAIESTMENLEVPPGRKPSEKELQRSKWFNQLPEENKTDINNIVTEAVDEAVFGFLAVLDGVRAFTNEKEAMLELVYKNGESRELLNSPEEIDLHDLYN
jgi:hypothetical protein